ncbi:Transposase [Bradyrhizobium erythrophlei]|nr:Transposase [Bradyrhizobium erythrophlei]
MFAIKRTAAFAHASPRYNLAAGLTPVNGMVRPCSCPTSNSMLGRGAKDEKHAMSQKLESAIAVIGIDIGKNSFHVVGHGERGAIVLRQKWSRGQVEARFANMPPCLVGMEACVGAHHLSRKLDSLSHDARLMLAKYVRPYSKGQKNDFRDAEAIAEAVRRPTMKFVATKTADQLDLQALHRVRERLVSQRTGIINQIRAFLLERGIPVRQGLRFLRQQLPELLAKRTDVLSPRMIRIIEDLSGDWRHLDGRIEQVTEEIEVLARGTEGCRQLMTVPGVGPIIASAMMAAIGNGAAFAKGRDFAAWLGLVSKQMSTGDRTILGRISKRGNRYLRMLFMQGARVILLRPENWQKHSFGAWLTTAAKRLHHNVLATALANKLARITWTVLAQGRSYEARVEPRTA